MVIKIIIHTAIYRFAKYTCDALISTIKPLTTLSVIPNLNQTEILLGVLFRYILIDQISKVLKMPNTIMYVIVFLWD